MAGQLNEERIEARDDADELFDVQHLTGRDIAQLEEALNTMDLEELVATVDRIVSGHMPKTVDE